jgi:hypothetical protein
MTTLVEARLALGIASAAWKAARGDDVQTTRQELLKASLLVDHLETAEKREEYDITVGPDRGYVGVSLLDNGAVIFDLLDGTHEQATAVANHEQAEAFYAQLGKLLGH